MKITGIVSEYNPFHNGHKFHIEKTRKETSSDFIIAIMSGNFVQRGEPAIFDKWTRTKCALLNGVDMVIEIPLYFATASAEFFSECAVRIMDSTGIIDTISFGSEAGKIEYIEKVADILYNEPEEFKNIIKEELSKGIVFPSARSKALEKITHIPKDILENPNNILGIEYLKSLKKIKSNIKASTIKREQAHYNSKTIESTIASATAIREYIKQNQIQKALYAVPENCKRIYSENLNLGKSPVFADDLSHFLNYKIIMSSPEYISEISDITEGLENRIYKAISENYTFSQMCDFIKSKRYTYTKIQRALLHTVLDIKKSDTEEFIDNGFSQYIRVLGFRREASIILKEMSKKSKLPIITNIKNANSILNERGLKMLEKEIQSTDIYKALSPNKNFSQLKTEYSTPMVMI